MSINKEAADRIAKIDKTAVATVLSDFPLAEDIEVRKSWHTLDPYYGRRLPTQLSSQIDSIEQLIEQNKIELQQHIARYNDLKQRALSAVSAYDICISSGGDPIRALRTALQLKHAHISYTLSLLVKLALDLDDVRAKCAGAKPPQMALF